MIRYLINGNEVDKDEFDAEFSAIIRAYFEENFRVFLEEDDQEEIRIGESYFAPIQLYDMFTEENQNEIYYDMFDEFVETQYEGLDTYWVQEYTVGDVDYHFAMEEVADAE